MAGPGMAGLASSRVLGAVIDSCGPFMTAGRLSLGVREEHRLHLSLFEFGPV